MRSYAPSLLLWIAVLVGTCSGQSNHTCSMPQPVANFLVDKFLGMWHEQKIYARWAEKGKPHQFRCLDIVLSPTNSMSLPLLAENRFVAYKDGPENVEVSDFIYMMHENQAIWKMFAGWGGKPWVSDSVVVQTDYTNWTIFYRCYLEDNGRHEEMQIWTRTRTPDPELIDILEIVVQRYGFLLGNGWTVAQTNC